MKELEKIRLGCQSFHSYFHPKIFTHNCYYFDPNKPIHKCGSSLPHRQYLVDQVKLPLVIGLEGNCNTKGSHGNLCVSHTGSGSDKHYCSVRIRFRHRGMQPNISVIFQVTVKNITDAEKRAYKDDVL